ncbi:sensor domain-containing diguanylate cyclase [Psychrosphaera aestuarii]|uniref:sensor domain-containing diguanylate cyclase n=1 Tax=Psychrosphaera aestuarii TaxID=1266052 RepID=UPI001B33A8AD|nr:sensor domain-containing diguanylate cyclase [Psychrosphaera aestuarii]
MSDQNQTAQIEVSEIHWLMDMFQSVDVGLVVLDDHYRIQVWNGFMENHSGRSPYDVRNQSLFETFPELNETWLRQKTDPVFVLKNRAFTIWEQTPHIFKFKNYRPITSVAPFMYQNATFIPLTNTMGAVTHICIIIYDVTDVAVSKLELEEVNTELKRLSQTDRLTNLNNRGFWEECLKKEFQRQRRTHNISSLLIFDIDHFKNVNDSYGHAAGDEAILHLAKVLKQNLRETDIGGRYGGEEFAVILPETDARHAAVFAERVRRSVEASTVIFNEVEIKFTVSLGIAEFHSDFNSHQKWIEAADSALYVAKSNGRNQVRAYVHKA